MAKRSKHRERLRKRQKRRVPPGSAPGTLAIDPAAPKPEIQVIAFGPQGVVERQLDSPNEIPQFLGKWPVCWVNVDGLGDANVLRRVGEIFKIHPLALEDIVNIHQRAKVEDYGETHFIVAHMVALAEHLDVEQISFFVGPGYVLTFQERPGGDSLGEVRARIRNPQSRLRTMDVDHILYALLDAVVDQAFPVLEAFGDRIEALEDGILDRPNSRRYGEVHEVKRDLLLLRRVIWPLRDALGSLVREPPPFVREETRPYLRDTHDHTIRIMDMIETYREMAADVTNLYLSSISNRMNEIMKVLTVISTLFIPLTFIVGIYGMNFHTEDSPWNMPELSWYYGYPACLALMGAISIGQLVFFYRKGWIGRGRENGAEKIDREAKAED